MLRKKQHRGCVQQALNDATDVSLLQNKHALTSCASYVTCILVKNMFASMLGKKQHRQCVQQALNDATDVSVLQNKLALTSYASYLTKKHVWKHAAQKATSWMCPTTSERRN